MLDSPEDPADLEKNLRGNNSNRPIAVFDSGLGGLTVLQAICDKLPHENTLYFGDTARVPYGIKSPQAIEEISRQNIQYLERFQPKMIVVACNTASAIALPKLKKISSVPVVGVVEPGAYSAVAVSRTRRIGVIGTEATVASRSYVKAIQKLDAEVQVFAKACPLFVPMVEEGRGPEDPLVFMAVKEYLSELLQYHVDTLVLGCTHYPILAPAIRRFMGKRISIVDSAIETAKVVGALLKEANLLKASPVAEHRYLVSDNCEHFAHSAGRFTRLAVDWVESVDLADLQPQNRISA